MAPAMAWPHASLASHPPRQVPRVGYLDATLPLLADPYGFISKHAQAVGSDIFLTRILLQDTFCMVGPEATRVFYDEEVFVRQDAAPGRIEKTLVGQGGVQGMDGEAHRHRKGMFLDVLDPAGVDGLVAAFERELKAADWRGEVVLYDMIRHALTRAVCAWAAVPLDDPDKRTAQLTALFQHAGDVGPTHWAARRARSQAEDWAAGIIKQVRDGELEVPGSALDAVAHHVDPEGDPLEPCIAAVELLNILRPTVAVSVFITLMAHAMEVYGTPQNDAQRRSFVHEVRRYYPFFPAAVARVRQDTTWNGYTLKAGARALLDLHGTNHHPAMWEAPQEFRMDRFLEESADVVAQGGGSRPKGHRCAGEPATVELMDLACRFLTGLDYDVPSQDLRINDRRLPALPRSRFVMDVRT